MSMRDACPPIAGSAAILVAILGATAAYAAATWTTKPGGAFTATATKAGFRDTKTLATFTCRSITLSGALKRGSGLPGSRAGSLTGATFTDCTAPVGVTFTITPKDLPWRVNLSGYQRGAATGNVSHIRLGLAGPSCSAVIDGTSAIASDGILKFSYSDGTGRLETLTIGGDLHFYNVMGCAGIFGDNDPLTVTATFPLSPKQTITSP